MVRPGNLYGNVTDQTGLGLPGVTITLTGQGPPQVQVTNPQGSFRYLFLSPGSYSVEAQLEGFQPSKDPIISIEAGENKNIELTLYSDEG